MVHYFTPTNSVSDVYNMHEEKYCVTHTTLTAAGEKGWVRHRRGRGEGREGQEWRGGKRKRCV